MKNLLLNIFYKLNDFLLSLIKKLQKGDSSLNLINKSYNSSMNCYKILLQNKSNKPIEDLLRELFYFLKTDEDLKNMSLLVISTGYFYDMVFNLHPNLLITKTTTFQEYLNESKAYINQRYEDGYLIDGLHFLEVLVFDAETKTFPNSKYNTRMKTRSYSTFNVLQSTKNGFQQRSFSTNKTINPLKEPYYIAVTNIVAIDIETININDTQTPVAISYAHNKSSDNNLSKDIVLINLEMLNQNSELAVEDLFPINIKVPLLPCRDNINYEAYKEFKDKVGNKNSDNSNNSSGFNNSSAQVRPVALDKPSLLDEASHLRPRPRHLRHGGAH